MQLAATHKVPGDVDEAPSTTTANSPQPLGRQCLSLETSPGTIPRNKPLKLLGPCSPLGSASKTNNLNKVSLQAANRCLLFAFLVRSSAADPTESTRNFFGATSPGNAQTFFRGN